MKSLYVIINIKLYAMQGKSIQQICWRKWWKLEGNAAAPASASTFHAFTFGNLASLSALETLSSLCDKKIFGSNVKRQNEQTMKHCIEKTSLLPWQASFQKDNFRVESLTWQQTQKHKKWFGANVKGTKYKPSHYNGECDRGLKPSNKRCYKWEKGRDV